jgi:integrase/recombinase XerD
MNDLLDDIAEYNLSNPSLTPYKNLKLWLDRWTEELERKKCAKKTIISYIAAANTFLDFVKRNRKIPMENIGARYINRYLINYQIRLAKSKFDERGLEEGDLETLIIEEKQKSIGKNDANFTILEAFENTLSQRLIVLKIFLKFITENNIEQHDYTRLYPRLAKIKIKDKFTDYLTAEELNTVIEYMDMWPQIYKDHKPKSSERYAWRDAFLMLIYALTGARSEEVTHIKLKDISLHKKEGVERYIIKIEKAKGGKKRSVAIKRKHIEKYISYFKRVLPDDNYYISSTYRKGYTNKPMSSNEIRTFSNNILKGLGINKTGLHSHRRGYVTKRVGEDGANASVVAKEVGNTTAILEKHYLKHTAEAFIE